MWWWQVVSCVIVTSCVSCVMVTNCELCDDKLCDDDNSCPQGSAQSLCGHSARGMRLWVKCLWKWLPLAKGPIPAYSLTSRVSAGIAVGYHWSEFLKQHQWLALSPECSHNSGDILQHYQHGTHCWYSPLSISGISGWIYLLVALVWYIYVLIIFTKVKQAFTASLEAICLSVTQWHR